MRLSENWLFFSLVVWLLDFIGGLIHVARYMTWLSDVEYVSTDAVMVFYPLLVRTCFLLLLRICDG